MYTSTPAIRTPSPALLIAGILLVSAAMRAPITALGPLLDPVRSSFALSASEAGLLTTLPLLAFATVSPIAAQIAHRFGLERAMFGALVLLAAGIVLRSAGTVAALYAGTCVIGSAIAVANVLLPSLLKREFPSQVARLTACYALVMILAAGAASALAVPLAHTFASGWPGALATLAVLPLIAGIAWLPSLQQNTHPRAAPGARAASSVWRAPLAWQVAGYLGLTCFVHFAAIAWLPSFLRDAGFSSARAGALHGWMQLAGGVPAVLLMPLMRRAGDQRSLAVGSPALAACGLVGLMVMPQGAYLWSFLFGMGMGSALVLSLAFVGLRAGNAQSAAALSGMAQCVGYLLAATGPTLFGFLHDATASWTAPFATCAVLCLAMGVLGLSVGRNRHLEDPA